MPLNFVTFIIRHRIKVFSRFTSLKSLIIRALSKPGFECDPERLTSCIENCIRTYLEFAILFLTAILKTNRFVNFKKPETLKRQNVFFCFLLLSVSVSYRDLSPTLNLKKNRLYVLFD